MVAVVFTIPVLVGNTIDGKADVEDITQVAVHCNVIQLYRTPYFVLDFKLVGNVIDAATLLTDVSCIPVASATTVPDFVHSAHVVGL